MGQPSTKRRSAPSRGQRLSDATLAKLQQTRRLRSALGLDERTGQTLDSGLDLHLAQLRALALRRGLDAAAIEAGPAPAPSRPRSDRSPRARTARTD